jgi:arylsulfatase
MSPRAGEGISHHVLATAPEKRDARRMRALALLALFLAPLAPLIGGGKPNVLVILTDDLGYSDLGCYGSEIETPTLDRLAANGLRFSQFYNTAKCHSSRVSLLTGRYSRQAGDESMYRAFTLPEVLRPAGYFTAMTGKWHLSEEPTDFGFDRYFGHLSGATNYYKGDKTFRLHGEPWRIPDEGFYTTTANVDFALRFIGEAREAKKPWFLYIAFNAPHAPIQPLKADYEKYRDRYTGGWDEIREARVAKQRKLGLLGVDAKVDARPDHIPAWESLPEATRDWESRRMAGYAALIDRVDQELARIVADLEKSGELDNTLLLFFSDNGACPFDRNNRGMDLEPHNPESNWTDSTGWAWARNSPFRFYKQNQFEGGIATPAIAHWPEGLKTKPGAINPTPAHLVDILPTIAAIAGASIPKEFPGRVPTPLAGVSLAPIFAGKALEKRPAIHLLFEQDRGLRDGDWKLVSFRGGPWELYNIAEDRTETTNLAGTHPERVAAMAAEWHRMAKEEVLATPQEQKPVGEEAPKRHTQWTDFSGKHPERQSGGRKKPKQ